MKTSAEPSEETKQTLEDLQAGICTSIAAKRLWTRFNLAERQQLGGNFEKAFGELGGVGMWIKLHNCSRARAIIEIGYELESFGKKTRDYLLQEIGEEPMETFESLERMAPSVTVLLVDRPRTLYWEGEMVDVDWDRHPKSWQYVELLVMAATRSEAVEREELGQRASAKLLTNRKYNLAELNGVPASFIDAIDVIRGTHRLTTPAAEVKVFDRCGDDEYVARSI